MEAKMDPPIHDPNLLSAQPFAEISLSLMLAGIRIDKSLLRRSGKPYNRVCKRKNIDL
jgi:hypothetical protein